MQRYKTYEPTQSVFISFSPEEYFPVGSFERFLVDVFGKVNFEECEEGTQFDQGGEAPYDPRAVFGAIFYGFARGVFSSRKLEKSCKQDMGFMYVSGFSTPDHSTFSRYISERAQLITLIFSKVLYIADQLGYLDYRLIATDGTKIKANASHQFTGTIENFYKRQAALTKKIEDALAEHRRAENRDEEERLTKRIERYHANYERVQHFLDQAERIETKKGKEILQNITDRECRVMKIDGSYSEGYNAQASCSDAHGLIVAAKVGNNIDDKENMFKMTDKVTKTAPEQAKEKLPHSKYLFDKGYYSTANILKAIQDGMDIYVPDAKDAKFYGNKRSKSQHSLGSEDCEIAQDDQGLFLRCPGGRVMRNWKIKMNNGKECYRFPVLTPSLCRGCNHHAICIGKQSINWKDFTILKAKVDERCRLSDYARKIHSPDGKRIYSNRMPLIERTFGYVKELIGFRRFLRRGLEKVNNEWLLVCTTYNLTRMFGLNRL